MRIVSIAILVGGLLSTTGCKQSPTGTSSASTEVIEGFSRSGITPDMTDLLLKNADHIDYMFTDIPLSMNQDGESSIYQDIRFLSNNALEGVITGCKPMARKIYLGNGEILTEADLYFSNGCLFQVFLDNEKPIYGNYLSQEGLTFYADLMEQAKQSMPAQLRNTYQVPDTQE